MTREKKVIEARTYFFRMLSHYQSVTTIEGLYAETIRRYVAEGVTTWEELGFTDGDVEERLRQAKVREAKEYFNKMTDNTYSVYTIEGLYAETIRRYVAEGVTTWEELGFTDGDVEERLRQAKERNTSTV